MKSIYHSDINSMREQPEMEKPDATKILGANPSGADYEVLDELTDVYNAHIASLRTIPCSPEAATVFKHGHVYGEGKDYTVREKWDIDNRGNPIRKNGTYFAFPLPQPVQEDEDRHWQIVVATVILKTQKFDLPDEIIKALKSEFNISKK